jgi:DnaJ like chaperone protein
MTLTEIAVIVFGLFAGYWVVGKLFFRTPGGPRPGEKSAPAGVAAAPASEASPPGWASVLEVPPHASVEEIRSAYHRLISQYHPDKVATLGAELKALAERKSQEINVAYREALRERGAIA